MENLFDNAHFGKVYKTRGGEKAIYIKCGESGRHSLIYEDDSVRCVHSDGCYHDLDCFVNPVEYLLPIDIVSEWDEPMELFKKLPHLNANFEIVEDWGYTPSLYHFDTKWFLSWVHCEESDTLLDYSADSPEEAIRLAYDGYKKHVKKCER